MGSKGVTWADDEFWNERETQSVRQSNDEKKK